MSTNQGVSPTALVAPFEKLRMEDVETVGGKNSSLGEMISQLAETGVRVPGGFATTAHAFREFLKANNLVERINAKLDALNVDDVRALTQAGAEIRQWVIDAPLPADLEKRNSRFLHHHDGPKWWRYFSGGSLLSHRRRLARRFLCRAARIFPERERH